MHQSQKTNFLDKFEDKENTNENLNPHMTASVQLKIRQAYKGYSLKDGTESSQNSKFEWGSGNG